MNWRKVSTEAKLLLVGIPVFIWTMLPIYHLVLFAISPKESALGGQPADQTHVLATLGLRYLRLDQVDMSLATVVCAMPLVLPLVYFMMKRLSR